MSKPNIILALILLLIAAWSRPDGAFAEEIDQKLVEMTFEKDAHGWLAGRSCRAFLKDGSLCVEADGGEPTLSRFVGELGGRIRIALEIRTHTPSNLVLFWTTKGSPRRSDDKTITRPLNANGNWEVHEFLLPVPDVLESVSLRFTAVEGLWEIKSLTAYRKRSYPLVVQKIVPYRHKDASGMEIDMLRYTILNDTPVHLNFQADHLADPVDLPGRETIDLAAPLKTTGNLATAALTLHPQGFPAAAFSVFRYDPKGKTEWISKPIGSGNGAKTFDLAPDARMARIRQGDEIVAILAPLVHRGGVVPTFIPATNVSETEFRFESPEARLTVEMAGESLRFRIEDLKQADDSGEPTELLEGPVVRLFGTLQSGLLPGVEFLGQGDVGSSTIDLEKPYNLRGRPDPLWITMPMAVLATEKAAMTLGWTDRTLRPTFFSPNDPDRTDDHRMSLMGRNIEATLEFIEPSVSSGEPASIRALRRYVQRHPFPEPQTAVRTAEEQRLLDLKALRGPLQDDDGARWGYAVEPSWPRKPYADMLSTLARLEGRVSNPKEIASGGADIANDAVYFMTNRVEEWKNGREQAIRSILALRNPDGSFLYRTRFQDIEQAATSFGFTAIRALEIMEFVRLTGNRELFEAVRQSLDYLKQADVPRGGFYQDSPLHTPDLLTAATVVWLATWAFEFSGEPEYLELARRHAYCGLPFVYQWSDRETMLYVAVPKFGGTKRTLPLWFGVSQPRVGLLYAYALNLLSRHDPTVDWRRVATGILHATERMQYQDGPNAGCLPEVFVLLNQERRSWSVNPCALVSLRLAVEDKLDSLFLQFDGKERYVSPYPLRPTVSGVEALDVPSGQSFQILRNGNRILGFDGSGTVLAD